MINGVNTRIHSFCIKLLIRYIYLINNVIIALKNTECPKLQPQSSLSDKEHSGTRPVGRRKGSRRKREAAGEVEDQQVADEDEIQPEVEIDQDLDRELENKSRQHNLTSANVRSIIHVSVNAEQLPRTPVALSFHVFLNVVHHWLFDYIKNAPECLCCVLFVRRKLLPMNMSWP